MARKVDMDQLVSAREIAARLGSERTPYVHDLRRGRSVVRSTPLDELRRDAVGVTGPGFIGALMVSLMMWAAIGLIVWLVVTLTAS